VCRLNLLHADGAGHKLRNQAQVVEVEVLPFDGCGLVQGELDGLAVAIDCNGHRLALVHGGALVHRVPVGIVTGIQSG
jgi:hypothetical protein